MADTSSQNGASAGALRFLDRARGEPPRNLPAPRQTTLPEPLQEAATVPQFAVRPPAPPARARRRHFFLLVGFVVFVIGPLLATAHYLWVRAADQYASYVGFSVRAEEQGSAIELLGGIGELSGSSSSDTDILFSYLTSQELVARVDAQVDLRGIWSRVSVEQDPVFAFDTAGTIEDLQAHWARKVAVVYDGGTGLIDLRVLAFEPGDAQRIAEAVLDESAQMIDGLSRIAQADAIRHTQAELEAAAAELKTARLAVTRFRNRTQIVDPGMDTQNQMGLLVTLQQQLAEALIDIDMLRSTTRRNDPRIAQAERRVEVIKARIASERQTLGLGEAGAGGRAFADLVGEYESLIVDREFAETAYTVARAAHDAALADARRQSRYLAAHVKPTLAERAEYPERLKIVALVAAFCLFGWAILCLVFYSLRDRN